MKIEINDGVTRTLLAEILTDAMDVRPVLPEIGEIVISSIMKNFEVGGRYSEPGSWRGGENRWQPLRSSTTARKSRRGGGILQQTGNLRNRFAWHIEGDSVVITNNVRYFAIHNFGGRINHPGGTPYIVMDVGGKPIARFLRKGKGVMMSRSGAVRLSKSGKVMQSEKGDTSRIKTTKAHAIDIPARPMMVIQDEDVQEMVAAIITHIGRKA